MNFLLKEMTYLRYFLPIAKHYPRESTFFVASSGKYNCPNIARNKKSLEFACQSIGAKIKSIDEIKNHPGLTFMIEGVLSEKLNKNHIGVSLTYMTDYRYSYKKYIDKVDHVIFPSQTFAEFYDTVSSKNLYMGSPKYDVTFNKEEIYKKYGFVKNKKYALIIYPKARDINKVNLSGLIDALRDLQLIPIIKHRGKESVLSDHGCPVFSDYSWFPHTTMELLEISDIVINFGSTTVKEAIISEKPIVNFDIKPHKHLSFLYNFNFVRDFKGGEIDLKIFENSINDLLLLDHKDEFKKCKEKHLFEGNTSNRILEYFN